jgi:hypothetical protein
VREIAKEKNILWGGILLCVRVTIRRKFFFFESDFLRYFGRESEGPRMVFYDDFKGLNFLEYFNCGKENVGCRFFYHIGTATQRPGLV